jgi:nucleotide-binding universal stress UspA family protein
MKSTITLSPRRTELKANNQPLRLVQPGRKSRLPRTILVPLDFSPCSEHALRYALMHARQFKARIIPLHVCQAFPIDYLLGIKSAAVANDWCMEQARVRLKLLARRCARTGMKLAKPIVKFGKPVDEIVEFALKQGVDLIIMATHGYTGLKHVQLGSTTERVVRHAHCPVLVVRGR